MMSKKALLPLAVVGIGLLGAAGMIAARPKVERRLPEVQPPLVRVVPVQMEDVQLSVRTQGSVAPRTESDLVPEVSGRVVWVSSSLAAGGFFELDDILLKIDRRDYEVALRRAEAAVARHASESQLAKANLERSSKLSERGVVSAADLDAAQNAARVADAALSEAQSVLDQARLDLERTEIRAPFAGRVREKRVDVGQFVTRGVPVGRVYAVDYAEVRLPIPDDQLAFIDLPLAYRGESRPDQGPVVILTAQVAGRPHSWRGRITRTEGEIDPRTRMLHAVAQVENPYGRTENPQRPPLAVGLFVNAEILGRQVDNVIVLTRAAMRGKDQVLVVDGDNRLRFRTVEVLRPNRDTVIIGSGLKTGEQVCVSPLEAAVDGMRVRVLKSDTSVGSAARDTAIR